ncbi:hypothetical protein LdCL_280037400 [Leishmania donovani]|uniref:Uncharacterized protein n=1 Tax=Leishmania donovani TaxID=5661 RepID=A0A3S7X225_LEIDO|nr:hypothetical protein LdCL_280037400 [Leishmania donovani]
MILGKDLGLRFAEGGTELPRASGSRILDWDLCYKELQQENARAVGRGTLAALERDNSDLCLRCDYLEARLQHTCGDLWLMLTNPLPPPPYRGALL